MKALTTLRAIFTMIIMLMGLEPRVQSSLASAEDTPSQQISVPLISKARPQSASVILGDTWFPIGPAPIDNFFSGGVTGRASAIAVNPLNPDDVWMGTAAGGVWHSNDGGHRWRPMSDTESFMAIGALALDGCTALGCTTVYAGTGENAIRRDTYYGGGLMIGRPPEEFGSFWTLHDGMPDFNFRLGTINSVVLDPTTSGSTKRLYITLSSGTTVSATEATVTAPEPSPGGFGIYESENDGSTWIKLTIAGTTGAKPTDLEMDPANSNVLYAGFLGKGVFKGTRDPANGSISWCPLNDGIPKPAGCPSTTGLLNPAITPFDHVEIAIFPGNSSILYAMLGQCPDRLIQNCQPYIFRSTNGGLNWDQRLAGNSVNDSTGCPRVYSQYTHALTVHPTSPDTLFLGGIQLCKSTNGGQTFVASDTNLASGGGTIHLDHHAIVIHPTNPNRMYSTSDGGFAFSTDGGTTWRPGNDDLQITGFQSIASSPLTSRVIGASQDNSGQMWIGSRRWRRFPCCGDGGFTIMDFDNPLVMYAATNFGAITRSTDGGVSWPGIGSGIPASDPRLFYAPFIQDPSPLHPLYYGTNRLFKSTDDGSSWTTVSPVLSTSPQPEIVTSPSVTTGATGLNVITAIGIAPSNSNRIYIGYYGGEIFVTSSACTTPACWTTVSTGLPTAPVTGIAIDPMDPNTAYVTFSGFSLTAHVWKTTNSGTSWSPIATGLPSGIPANAISIEPSAHENLWLGTDTGVFKSTDSGSSWAPFNKGLPNAPVYMISIDETHGRVYAATHGRGAFVLTKPFLSNFEGWVDGQIWDIPVYGYGFLPNQSATMQIIQQDGTVCAQGSIDPMGGEIQTDDMGQLVTNQGSIYHGKQVAWACYNGACLGGVPIGTCNQYDASGNPVNLISTIRVISGGVVGFDKMLGCPLLANPPSSTLGLPDFPPSGVMLSEQNVQSASSFDLVSSVQVGDGSTRALCTVNVPFQAGEESQQVLTRAQDAVNASAACAANTVSAEVDFVQPGSGSEDDFTREPRLRIKAPGISGSQLVTSLHTAPGSATGVCFDVGNIGVPVVNSITIMKVKFEALPAGAAGGEITVVEKSDLGTCEITLSTTPGETAVEIAAAFAAAFQAPGIPGPNPGCPADYNPREVALHGDSIITVMASGITVCIRDMGVGFSLTPEELSLETSDLSITKVDSPDPVTAGSNLTYTLTVTNNGPSDATGVMVTDTLPAGATFDPANSTPGCTEAGGVVTCAIGNLANGANATVTIAVTVDPATPVGTITNTATVTGQEKDSNMGDNTASTDTTIIPPSSVCTTLDDFNRADGPLGNNWDGHTTGYRIRSNQVTVRTGGPIYWQPEAYGSDQEACVTLTRINPKSRQHALLLKVQELNNWRKGAILVSYNARSGNIEVKARDVSHHKWILVGTFTPATPVVDGDQLRAKAFADGTVQVLIHDTSLGTADAGSFYVNKGGQIGLWFRGSQANDDDDEDNDEHDDSGPAARRALLDDFGGGTIAAP